MKCLRCGWCCKNLSVVIVVDPDRGVDYDNLKVVTCTSDNPCPHLRGDKPGEYWCAVHDKEWFSETSCAQYQSHGGDCPCQTGKFVLENLKNRKPRSEA